MDDATNDVIPGDWRVDDDVRCPDPRIADENDVTVAYVDMGNNVDLDIAAATAALMAESKRMSRACRKVAAAFTCGNLTDEQEAAVEACIACLESLAARARTGGG